MTHADQLHHRVQVVDPETGLLTPFFFRWLVALYERTGGPDDLIANTEMQLNLNPNDPRLNDLLNKVQQLEIESIYSATQQKQNDKQYALLFS